MGTTNFPNGITSFGVPVLGGLAGLNALRKVYFVAGGGGSARTSGTGSDGNSGLSMDQAFATIQKAMDAVNDQDSILVMHGDYDEAVTTGLAIGSITAVASGAAGAGRGRFCNLLGISPGPIPSAYPQIYNRAGDTVSLDMRAEGWRVSGLRLVGDSGSPLCMRVNLDQSADTPGTSRSPGVRIDNCVFHGNVASNSGIDFKGAPFNVYILDNVFELFKVGQQCIKQSSSSIARAGRCIISRNSFIDGVEYIDMGPGGMQASEITYNTFMTGITTTTTLYLKNTGGRGCMVTGNFFDGTYTIAGGYEAGTGDHWFGNQADPAGSQVGADGFVTAVPQ